MKLAADGSWNITVVDGSTRVGLLAANGSLNVVQSNGSSRIGLVHSSGALNVTNASGSLVSLYASDGSMNVQTTTTKYNSGQRVTVVSGALV